MYLMLTKLSVCLNQSTKKIIKFFYIIKRPLKNTSKDNCLVSLKLKVFVIGNHMYLNCFFPIIYKSKENSVFVFRSVC